MPELLSKLTGIPIVPAGSAESRPAYMMSAVMLVLLRVNIVEMSPAALMLIAGMWWCTPVAPMMLPDWISEGEPPTGQLLVLTSYHRTLSWDDDWIVWLATSLPPR